MVLLDEEKDLLIHLTPSANMALRYFFMSSDLKGMFSGTKFSNNISEFAEAIPYFE